MKQRLAGFFVTGYSSDIWAASAVTSAVAAVATEDLAVQVFGITASVLFACFCGAAIAVWFLPKASRWGMFISVLIGTIAGGYSTPAVADFFSIQKLNAVGFLTGLLAYALIALAFSKGEKIILKRLGGD